MALVLVALARPPHGPVSAADFLVNSRLADRAPEQVAFLRRLPDAATSTHQSSRRSTSLPRGDLSGRSFGQCKRVPFDHRTSAIVL